MTAVARAWPLARFHLLQNVNATRDSFTAKRDSEIYYGLQNETRYAISKSMLASLSLSLPHVINILLLTEKRDSLLGMPFTTRVPACI
jgi:hypothetical protein